MIDSHDNVLDRFASCGPEFGPGLSNHGPMAAEALLSLGRGEAAEAWADWYATRLDDAPRPRHSITDGDWREALGEIGRVADWTEYFRRELGENRWTTVLQMWAPRLMPGVMAGATHGLIRTAHAVRALDRAETQPRISELALGLAYWAARYQELPTEPEHAGDVRVREALARVPLLDEDARGAFLIFDMVKRLEPSTFAPAINWVDARGSFDAFVSDLTTTFVRQYLANASHAAIAFVHTVTAPSALRFLAPHLEEQTVRSAMRHTWQACASIYAAYARTQHEAPVTSDTVEFDRDELADRAVASRDEHAIKFTEACLREHDSSGDPAFILAADDVLNRLRAR